MKFNTAIAALMALINDIADNKQITRQELRTFLLLLNPFAPHITEEIWEAQGFAGMLNQQNWPGMTLQNAWMPPSRLPFRSAAKSKRASTFRRMQTSSSCWSWQNRTASSTRFWKARPSSKEIVVPGKLVNIVAK